MNATDFTALSPGALVNNLDGRRTFLPNPLPPAVAFPMSLLKKVDEVANSIGRLDGYATSMPDQQILIRSFVRREAQLSSYIENTFASYDEVALAQKSTSGKSIAAQTWETVNAEQAIGAGVHAVFDNGQPITLGLIRQMHGLLLDNVQGHESRGRFREMQVYIGKPHESPDMARFVPPPSHLITDLMDDFCRYITVGDELLSLIQIGLLHYQFETIHPFEDGNGRLGRILILLGLCQHKLLSVPLLNPSLYFERNRQAYYDALLAVSTRGEWIGWISFFTEGLRVAVEESVQKLRELNDLKNRYHDQIHALRGSSLLVKLVDNLFVMPVLSISDAAEIMNLTFEAARLNMNKLVGAGILRVIEGHYPRRYIADTILKAVNAEPTRR